MNEPSYFDDPVEAEKLKTEALSWLDTPFRPYHQELKQANPPPTSFVGDIKGMGGGIDCVGLAQEIFARIEATQPWIFPREAADFQPHQSGDKILKWFRGEIDDPQSTQLSELFVELQIPDIMKESDAEKPRDFFKPGDILVLQHGGLFHMPIIYDTDLHFVNAIPRQGVIEGTIQDASYSTHLVAAFRLKPT